jgi:hypothetical protein
VNTPAKLTQQSQTNIDGQLNEGMVSPKRKVEHFQHLYIANNVKTSTFSEQTDKNNIISNKNNLNNCHEYSKNNCSHPSTINMVPERDTDPNKTPPGNTVGSLKLSPQGTSTSRQHHHVTIQELRLQVNKKQIILDCYCNILYSKGHKTATVPRMKIVRQVTRACQIMGTVLLEETTVLDLTV